MAHEGLKVISYAFKDMSLSDFEQMKHSYNMESKEFRAEMEHDLTYLCTFGLVDPIREDIQLTVNAIRSADGPSGEKGNSQVNIKMVTGDHIETARWVGIQSGIIEKEDAYKDGVVMTGDEF
jgi:magnesium-transporting ATPase (P-type)